VLAFSATQPEATALDIHEWILPEVREIRAEKDRLRSELALLPDAPNWRQHHTERFGYHSGFSSRADTVEWVDIDLGQERTVDSVALLVPAQESEATSMPGYGFPLRFRVELQPESPESESVIIADYTSEDFPNPGALPVWVDGNGTSARSVRIVATRLRQEGNEFCFALGEVMVFSGGVNIAAGLGRGQFDGSRRSLGAVPRWGFANLVDGHSVCGPPRGKMESPSLGYHSQMVNLRNEPKPVPRWVEIDLGEEVPVEQVRLFPAHPPEFTHRPGFGFPTRAHLELSTDSTRDSPHVVPLRVETPLAPPQSLVNPADNPVGVPAGGRSARYIKLVATSLHNANGLYNLALAEMEVWSNGRNVATKGSVRAFDSLESEGWSKAALIDGYTSRHQIVDSASWIKGLDRRRQIVESLERLDQKEVRLVATLKRRTTLAGVTIAGLFLALLPILALRRRIRQKAEIIRLRDRIAQDLHDDIGSSLGSIVLAADDALVASGSAQKEDLLDIRSTARATIDSMQDMLRLLQRGGYDSGDLGTHLEEIAARQLRGVPYEVKISSKKAVSDLPINCRRDLILLFKEALHNLARHSQATEATIVIERNPSHLAMTIRDDGIGFDPAIAHSGMGLGNMRRRTERHGGTLQIESQPGEGTKLRITLPYHG